VESAIQKMKIQSLQAQLLLSRKTCSFLANQLKASTLADGQRAAIAQLWYKALKDCHNLQFVIELLERQNKDSEASPA
jgi:hypothetical protein